MLQPRKTKFRNAHRWRLKWIAIKWSEISFGDYWLKAVERWYLSSRQIEAARRALVRYIKRWGKVWIRIFPDKPYSKKPLEVPMWGGKWGLEMYRAPVKPWRVLFELTWVTPEVAREALRLASHKLPIKTKIIID